MTADVAPDALDVLIEQALTTPRADFAQLDEIAARCREQMQQRKRGTDPDQAYRPYAALTDPAFQARLLAKKEFFNKRIERMPDVADFAKAAQDACAGSGSGSGSSEEDDFQLSETQSFVRNFLSPRTPYNGLLLFHDVGVGKTCSAISIAERFVDRRVTILAPLNVQASFRKQMFDASKVRVDGTDGTLSSAQCTGTRFLRGFTSDQRGVVAEGDLDAAELDVQRLAAMDSHASRLINAKYAFSGYYKFATRLAKLSDAEIVQAYANHVFIVDEAHNLRSHNTSGSKPVYRALARIMRLVHGTKLVLLTATPMFNDAREIVDLINLLLLNDKRPLLKKGELFADDGTLTDAEALSRACVGYVSHVSGRNPLRFPILLDPGMDGDPQLVDPKQLPTLDVTGQRIAAVTRIRSTRIVGSVMSRSQYLAYTESGVMDMQVEVDDVNEDEVDNLIVEEDAEEDVDADDGAAPAPPENVDADRKGVVTAGDEDTEGLPTSSLPGFETANIVFPALPGRKDVDARQRRSATMFWSSFRRVPGAGGEFQVEYMPGSMAAANGGFLSFANLREYSCKFRTIIDRILTSSGVIFVYSRFLWAGLVPLAIALEHVGFTRYGQRNILRSPQKSQEKRAGRGAYIMLTSNTRLCSRAAFARDLAAAVSPLNARGEVVRVILACGVATEGFDFKCVRSVHLVDPWYHSNKINQIVGRASRNCLHAHLPVELRNVTVYLHATLPPEEVGDDARETVDLHAYRISEFKQSKINTVEDVLRSASVDCELNRHAQQEQALAKTTVTLVTSQGTTVRNFKVAKGLALRPVTCRTSAAEAAKDAKKGKKEASGAEASSGTDDSTFDPWYHATAEIEQFAAIMEAAFGALHRDVLTFAELEQYTAAMAPTTFDRDVFVFALQHCVERKRLLYRSGVYVRNNIKSSNPEEPRRCVRIAPPATRQNQKLRGVQTTRKS